MKSIARTLVLSSALLALTAEAAETLKDTFKDKFLVGTAVNRGMVTGGAGFRRSAEQAAKDKAAGKKEPEPVIETPKPAPTPVSTSAPASSTSAPAGTSQPAGAPPAGAPPAGAPPAGAPVTPPAGAPAAPAAPTPAGK